MRQIAKRKEVFHGGWSLCFFPSAFPLVVTQSCKLPLKNKVLTSLAPSWAQKFLSILQSLSTWIIDSGSKRYKRHVRSTCTPPPLVKHSLTPMLLHKHIHTKVWIREMMLAFHTHWPEKGVTTSSPLATSWYALLSSKPPWVDIP